MQLIVCKLNYDKFYEVSKTMRIKFKFKFKFKFKLKFKFTPRIPDFFFPNVVSFCDRFFLKVRFGATVFASLRRRVRRTLYAFYCPYFSPKVVVNFTINVRGHFASLIDFNMHLMTYISGRISLRMRTFL